MRDALKDGLLCLSDLFLALASICTRAAMRLTRDDLRRHERSGQWRPDNTGEAE